jgi:hypothetical protein
MVRTPWKLCLWPGLPHLWQRGAWLGLLVAIGFAVALNLLLLASFVWVELLSPGSLRLAWMGAAFVWIVSAGWSAWFGVGATPRQVATSEAMFREALSEYIQENWFEAERILGRLLERDARDVEARLLLATLLRHGKRYEEALEQLARLELLCDAQRWAREIALERQWLAEAMTEVKPSSPERTDATPTGSFPADSNLVTDNPSPDASPSRGAQRAA